MSQLYLTTLHLVRASIAPALALAMYSAASAQQQSEPTGCGNFQYHNSYGPYDYRKDKDKLPIVDNHHFLPQVEALTRGVSGPIGGELDYVLHAFPNHHRALIALLKWGERLKTTKPPGARYDIECYFVRALRFAPDDTVPRMLFARYLHSLKRTDEAVSMLERTAEIAGDNGFTHYNIGLFYMEIGQSDRALAQAHRAATLGFERPELRGQLERAGKWQELAK